MACMNHGCTFAASIRYLPATTCCTAFAGCKWGPTMVIKSSTLPLEQQSHRNLNQCCISIHSNHCIHCSTPSRGDPFEATTFTSKTTTGTPAEHTATEQAGQSAKAKHGFASFVQHMRLVHGGVLGVRSTVFLPSFRVPQTCSSTCLAAGPASGFSSAVLPRRAHPRDSLAASCRGCTRHRMPSLQVAAQAAGTGQQQWPSVARSLGVRGQPQATVLACQGFIVAHLLLPPPPPHTLFLDLQDI